MHSCLVVGGGEFGLALSSVLSRNEQNFVRILLRDPNVVHSIQNNGNHPNIFPQHKIKGIPTCSWNEGLHDVNIIFICVSSNGVLSVVKDIASNIKIANPIIVLCSKGLVIDSNNPFYSDAILNILPNARILILSGPNFADELVANIPAIATIAGIDEGDVESVINVFYTTNMILKKTNAIYATQIAGTFKNIIAIYIGIIEAMMYKKYGIIAQNVVCLVILEMIDELSAIVKYYDKSQDDIINTPACIGDILLTCTSQKSRNKMFGLLLGKELLGMDQYTSELISQKINNILSNNIKTIEGYSNLTALYHMSLMVDMDCKYIKGLYGLLILHDIRKFYICF